VPIARESNEEKGMNRNVSFALVFLASIFAIDGSAVAAAQVQGVQHKSNSQAKVTQPITSPRSDIKKVQPAPISRPDRLPPKMYPPGPSGHGTLPSYDE
jgi:hypothetical protein